MWRIGVLASLALALSACASTQNVGLAPAPPSAAAASAAPPATGAWKFDRRIDRATGKPVGKAFVTTERTTVRSRKAFATATSALQLQCFKGKPVVQIIFPYRIGSNRSASLSYRFDDKPPRDPRVRFLPNYKIVVIEEPADVQRFVAELRTSKTLFVSINSLTAGAARAEFPVQHPEPALDTGFGDCPLSPGANRRA